MKKIITAIAIAGALIFNANAYVTISWNVADTSSSGFWIHDANGGWPGTGMWGSNPADGNNWVCQLVDAGTSAPDWNALLTAYQGGTWNQGTVLDSNMFDGNAATPGFADSYAADNTFNGHYIYIRFFNNTSTQAGFIYSTAWVTPGADNGLLAQSDAPTGILGTIMTAGGPALGAASADISAGDGSPGFTTVAVPEPTSLALFGLGGLLVGLRRKLRKS